jgi:hypothetical protein
MQPIRRGGILGGAVDGQARLDAAFQKVAAAPGSVVTHASSGFRGTITSITDRYVNVAGATGLSKTFPNAPGAFLQDGRSITLVPIPEGVEPAAPPIAAGQVSATRRTASGSRAIVGAKAKVARASRILVEGAHDAELLEKVWGDDLRVEGIVVERLDGADHLAAVMAEFGPARTRRLGVLLDHLVPGSKEERLANSVRKDFDDVLITGTPYVDIWAAIRPAAMGIDAWPEVPKGQPWKDGVCRALNVRDPARFWKQILNAVEDWRDLEQPLIAAVETLIDFVTQEK